MAKVRFQVVRKQYGYFEIDVPEIDEEKLLKRAINIRCLKAGNKALDEGVDIEWKTIEDHEKEIKDMVENRDWTNEEKEQFVKSYTRFDTIDNYWIMRENKIRI